MPKIEQIQYRIKLNRQYIQILQDDCNIKIAVVEHEIAEMEKELMQCSNTQLSEAEIKQVYVDPPIMWWAVEEKRELKK